MSERKVEGLWNCVYCGAKGIGGLTKNCPSCGHPQDKDVKFYLGEKKNYLDEDTAKQYGQGADWLCPYCDTLNRVNEGVCKGCGAAREQAEKDYFTNQKPAAPPKPTKPEKIKRTSQLPEWAQDILYGIQDGLFTLLCRIWPQLLLLGAVAIAALVLFWPRTYDSTITAATWERQIDIEAFRTVQEQDWQVPDGGRVYDQKEEVHHYEQVLDHYETRTREVAEQVEDGYDYKTEYTDNGDGTFSENTISAPRYRTEYRTETYDEPIYRDEPCYATKYYYEIDKWVVDRSEKSEGTKEEPYWPAYTLAENERAGEQTEQYLLTVQTKKGKTYTASLPRARWAQYQVGDGIKITVSAGVVTGVDGESVFTEESEKPQE